MVALAARANRPTQQPPLHAIHVSLESGEFKDRDTTVLDNEAGLLAITALLERPQFNWSLRLDLII